MGRPDFGRSAPFPAPPLPHALHDEDVDGVVAEGMDDGLPVEHGTYGIRTSERWLTSFPIYA